MTWSIHSAYGWPRKFDGSEGRARIEILPSRRIAEVVPGLNGKEDKLWFKYVWMDLDGSKAYMVLSYLAWTPCNTSYFDVNHSLVPGFEPVVPWSLRRLWPTLELRIWPKMWTSQSPSWQRSSDLSLGSLGSPIWWLGSLVASIPGCFMIFNRSNWSHVS